MIHIKKQTGLNKQSDTLEEVPKYLSFDIGRYIPCSMIIVEEMIYLCIINDTYVIELSTFCCQHCAALRYSLRI